MDKVQHPDYYHLLGIPPSSSLKEITTAYRNRISAIDQKKNPSGQKVNYSREQILQIQKAYDTLSNPSKRLAYHRSQSIPDPPGIPESLETLKQVKKRVVGEVEQTIKRKNHNSVYLDYFGFKEKPFDLTPDPKYLYLSAKHKEVLAHLVFGLQHNNGFLKVVGEVGTGKTTICRSFLKDLGDDFHFAYIFHPCISSLDLLQSINSEFGLKSERRNKRDLLHDLNQFLLQKRKLGHRVAVIIDEAQNLSSSILEELRLLSNLETDTEKLIHIILIGQPELDDVLRQTKLRQLRQRITIQWKLLPLNKRETRGYVQHRLNVAGGKGRVFFEPAACDWIYKMTQGIPRMINVLADRALLIAYTKNTKRITPKIVKLAAKDIGGTAYKPNGWGVFGKVIGSAVAAAAIVLVGLHYLVDFNFSSDELFGRKLKQLVQASGLSDKDEELIPDQKPGTKSYAFQSKPQKENFVPAPTAVETISKEPGTPAQRVSLDLLRLSKTDKLVTYLSSLTLEESRVEALKWILQSWDIASEEIRTASNLDPSELEEAFGLSIFDMNGTIKHLTTLNYPAILEVNLPNAQGTKYMALISIQGSNGIFGSVDKLEIPLSTIEPLLNHRVSIVWQDFENLPGVLELGHEGKESIWLQKNLRLLGFFQGREATNYGKKTKDAVAKFQRFYNIKDDGRFNTESKIMLYSLLNIYPTPTLVRR